MASRANRRLAPASEVAVPTSELLDLMTRQFINAINTRNFDESTLAWSYISPNLEADFESTRFPSVTSRKQAIAMYRRMTEEFPEYCYNLSTVDTAVDEVLGTASQFVNGTVTGYAPGVTMHSTGVIRFQKTDGIWTIVSYLGVRGGPGPVLGL